MCSAYFAQQLQSRQTDSWFVTLNAKGAKFADSWVSVQLSNGSWLHILVQSKRRTSGRSISTEEIREELKKCRLPKHMQFLLLIIGDGPVAAPRSKDAPYIATVSSVNLQKFMGPLLYRYRVAAK